MGLAPTVRRILRRRRRTLAAAAAALATVFALLSLQPAPPPPASAQPSLLTGEVAVPIVIDTPAIASVLAPGDVIDVYSLGQDGRTSLIAADARILELPGAAGMGGPDAVVVIAVRESAGRAVATVAGRVGVVIRQHGQGA